MLYVMIGIFRFFVSEQCKIGKFVLGEIQINLYCEFFIKNNVFVGIYFFRGINCLKYCNM